MSRIPRIKKPDEWKLVKLREICILRSENFDPKNDGTLKYIGLEHIDSGDPNIKRFGYEKDVISTQHRFYPNDILYGKLRPYLDKAVIIDSEGICSSDILVIKPINNEVLSNYLINILHSSKFLKYINTTMSGTTLPRTNWRDIGRFEIYLPYLKEQHKIASILSNIDNIINITYKIINQLQLLKKGLMQHLFTKGIGHTEFKETKFGKIPKEWKIDKLINFIECKKNLIVAGPFGSNLKVEDYCDQGIPIIRLQNIEYFRFINQDIKYITSEKAEELKYHSFKKGDIVLAKLGDPVGKTCIVPNFLEYGIVTSDVVRIRNENRIFNNYFLMSLLNSYKIWKQLTSEVIGSTRPRVNLDHVRNLLIPCPPIEEQEKIALILFNVDDILIITEKIIGQLQILKKGLMQDLLTGKKRVKLEN